MRGNDAHRRDCPRRCDAGGARRHHQPIHSQPLECFGRRVRGRRRRPNRCCSPASCHRRSRPRSAAVTRCCWPSARSNATVALVINPWRQDRIPDRFPNIVQDAIVIGLFAVAATIFLPEKIAATTAVGAVVIGFALQDTLGNLFSGLAIQVEKPFHVGQWVTIGGKDGKVAEITWRATKIRTKTGNFVVVPNSVLSRDTITNYSEPNDETRIEIEVGASYDTPPNDVKTVIRAALLGEPMLVASRAARCAGRRLRPLGGHVPGALLDHRLCRRRTGARSGPDAHLLRVSASRHHDSVPDPGLRRAGALRRAGTASALSPRRSPAWTSSIRSTTRSARQLVESARPLLYAAGESIVARRRRRATRCSCCCAARRS